MKAVVVRAPGPAAALELASVRCPQPEGGWILIQVEAFGLNRAEVYMRRGKLPSVTFPRIPGVECVGTVREDPSGTFGPGQKVAALQGGMGTVYDGSYTEFACVRATQVIAIESELDWTSLAALPQSFLTAHGALYDKLDIERRESLLVRGGSSAVGMAAIRLAKAQGLLVLATTRNPDKVDRLQDAGADHVIIDDHEIAARVRAVAIGGADAVLELVGPLTIADSLRACAPGGAVCAAGVLGEVWHPPKLRRLAYLLEHVDLTSYNAETIERATAAATLQDIVDRVADGRLDANIAQVFPFAEIVAAHTTMEAASACGKLVVSLR